MSSGQSLPEPLVPAEVNLQTLPSMLFDVARFRDSSFVTEVDPASGFFAVVLWSAAWHQQPSGSLPSSPSQLAKLAGLGRDLASWERHSRGALYGFVLCRDGRYYHPIVAMKAMEQWSYRLSMKLKSGAGNKRRHGTPFDQVAVEAQLKRAHEAIQRLVDMGVKRTAEVPTQGALPLGLPPGSIQGEEEQGKPSHQGSQAESQQGSEVKRSEVKSKEEPPIPPAETPPAPKKRGGRQRERLDQITYTAGFERFWEVYPKKVGRAVAWAAWKRDRLDEFASTIIANVEKRKKEDARWLRDGGRYVPDPSTFINQQRWNDEMEPVRSSGARHDIETENDAIAETWGRS